MRQDLSLSVAPAERPLIVRRRFQLIGAILVGAILPYLLRYLLTPELQLQFLPRSNAFVGNLGAVVLAMWMRLSIETYPGIRASYAILPVAVAAHGVMLLAFFVTQVPYDRISLTLGFLFHVLWNYTVWFSGERKVRQRIGIVPVGHVAKLSKIAGVDWVILEQANLDQTVSCSAIVADFSADLPDEWEGFLASCALQGRIVYQVKQLTESLTGRVELDHISENSFGLLIPARGYFHLKTVLDFLTAVALLPFVLPVMAAAAAAIRSEGGGPVLFTQRRLGYKGRSFTAYKFRTMRDGPEETGNADLRSALATGENDPRVTRVGRFLRRSRIDELPQIINILRGEMSWIGPRPEPELLSQWFLVEIPFYQYRHVVKPGISGWAQVNQGYVSGVAGIKRKLQFDFYYIKYFSPWLDLLILFRTMKTMLTGAGAR